MIIESLKGLVRKDASAIGDAFYDFLQKLLLRPSSEKIKENRRIILRVDKLDVTFNSFIAPGFDQKPSLLTVPDNRKTRL